jgi:hypothetical protein
MRFKVFYEKYIVVEAIDETDAIVKAGEQPDDEWQTSDTDAVGDE